MDMKTKKLFQCKFEELPVIGEMVVGSARRDIVEFGEFSSIFTPSYFDVIDLKILNCRKKMRTWVVVQELKATTETVTTKTKQLRVMLNLLEGYIKLSSNDLDVKGSDMGLSIVRKAISHGNTEAVVMNVGNLLASVERNRTALEAHDMKSQLIDDIVAQTEEINALNIKQSEQESLRNRLTEENIDLFNDLWKALLPVFETGRVLYRGVDEAKLKDYTVTQLVKRINHTGKEVGAKTKN
jgi:hypothetical protein